MSSETFIRTANYHQLIEAAEILTFRGSWPWHNIVNPDAMTMSERLIFASECLKAASTWTHSPESGYVILCLKEDKFQEVRVYGSAKIAKQTFNRLRGYSLKKHYQHGNTYHEAFEHGGSLYVLMPREIISA